MNVKKYLYALLTGSTDLVDVVGSNGIVSSYPNEVKTFPCVIIEDVNASDEEFNDNLPDAESVQCRIHIFSKMVKSFAKCEDIAEIVHSVMKNDYWAMTGNNDTADVDDNIRHRVLDFKRDFFHA